MRAARKFSPEVYAAECLSMERLRDEGIAPQHENEICIEHSISEQNAIRDRN